MMRSTSWIVAMCVALVACSGGTTSSDADSTSSSSSSTGATGPSSPSATTGACANPYQPVSTGAAWTYDLHSSATEDSTYTDTISSVTSDAYSVTSSFGDLTTVVPWSCTPQGLVALQYTDAPGTISNGGIQLPSRRRASAASPIRHRSPRGTGGCRGTACRPRWSARKVPGAARAACRRGIEHCRTKTSRCSRRLLFRAQGSVLGQLSVHDHGRGRLRSREPHDLRIPLAGARRRGGQDDRDGQRVVLAHHHYRARERRTVIAG